jgi:hypothetical protein
VHATGTQLNTTFSSISSELKGNRRSHRVEAGGALGFPSAMSLQHFVYAWCCPENRRPLFRIVLIAAGAKIFEVRAADCPVANALATTAL